MASTAIERWRTVLGKASRAFGGRDVALWTADGRGGLRPLATSSGRMPPSLAALALAAQLRRWRIAPLPGQSWVALHGAEGRWYVAPVRAVLPAGPPLRPAGAERRAPERLTLELAGLCVGLLESNAGVLDSDPVRLAAIAAGTEAFLWITDRALRVGACTGPGLDGPDVPPECAARTSLVEGFERGLVTGESLEAHKRALTGKGVSYTLCAGARSYDARVEPLRDGSGTIVGVMGVARDATERERALEVARRAEEELASFLRHAALPTQWLAPDGTILRVNDAALEFVGYEREEYLGRNLTEFLEDPQVLRQALRAVAPGAATEEVEARLRRKNGARCRVQLSLTARFEGGRVEAVRVLARELGERRALERRRGGRALHDALTDLPAGGFFTERLALALERARRDRDYRFALLVLDVDTLRTVNERLGRATGDHLLQQIGQRLRRTVRPGDIVARLGADEFALLLDDVLGAVAVEEAARRLGAQVAGRYVVVGHTLDVTLSLGAVLNASAHTRPEEVLRDARAALARAKADGRGRWRIGAPLLGDASLAPARVAADLARALTRAEFRLVFDPIVALSTGRVHAFEALLRWHHPVHGVLRPLDFLPVATQSGALVPIGRWVLAEACRQARTWRDAGGAPVGVTVNVSRAELADRGFVAAVREALGAAGLAPASLGLEVTESALADARGPTVATLDALRRLDVQVHLDDFGTGSASLGRLRPLPLDGIKVDPACVHRLGGRRTDTETVRSIVARAKTLGLGVIAEGVETGAQRARLMAYGCELGQGLRFAEPLAASEVGGVLAEATRAPRP